MYLLLLMQGPAAWWHVLLDNALALTILIIFIAACIGAVLRQRRRDKCLWLLNDHHVTYLSCSGRVLWGDLTVFSKGIELGFDAAHPTRRGLLKSSVLIHADEMEDCFALVRLDAALTEAERRQRVRQIKRTFRPGILRRGARVVRNQINTIRDAFDQALGTLLEAVAKSRPGGAALAGQESKQVGKELVSTVGNAYDPMLERHIGSPVVLRISNPSRPDDAAFEFPGYLVDYSEKYLALFNVDHEALEKFEIEVDSDFQSEGMTVTVDANHVRVTCTGPEALVIRRVTVGPSEHELLVAMLPGSSLELSGSGDPADRVKLACELTHRLDLICPRAIATVCFGSQATTQVRFTSGLAPVATEPDEPRADEPRADEPRADEPRTDVARERS